MYTRYSFSQFDSFSLAHPIPHACLYHWILRLLTHFFLTLKNLTFKIKWRTLDRNFQFQFVSFWRSAALVNCSISLFCMLIILIWSSEDPGGSPRVTAPWLSSVCEGLRNVSIRNHNVKIMSSGISETNQLQKMALECSHAYFWNIRAWGSPIEIKNLQTEAWRNLDWWLLSQAREWHCHSTWSKVKSRNEGKEKILRDS